MSVSATHHSRRRGTRLRCASDPAHRTPASLAPAAVVAGMIPRVRNPSSIGVLLQHLSAVRRPQLLKSPCSFPLALTRGLTHAVPETRAGTTTPVPDDAAPPMPTSPFYFEAGYALFAKRPSRPFPPPFLSLPSTSFSEPLSTHNKSRDRRPQVNGELIRGVTNGDDAVLVSDFFIGANDGVGAWGTRERGHAAYEAPQFVLDTACVANIGGKLMVKIDPALLGPRS